MQVPSDGLPIIIPSPIGVPVQPAVAQVFLVAKAREVEYAGAMRAATRIKVSVWCMLGVLVWLVVIAEWILLLDPAPCESLHAPVQTLIRC